MQNTYGVNIVHVKVKEQTRPIYTYIQHEYKRRVMHTMYHVSSVGLLDYKLSRLN